MSYINITPIASEHGLLASINSRFDTVEAWVNNQALHRVSTFGQNNAMQTLLDMNGNEIINLPDPTLPTHPVRLMDMQAIVSGIADHGILTGLTDDDHPQYLTMDRGTANFYAKQGLTTGVVPYIDFTGNLNGNTNNLFFDNNGYFGIGEPSPVARLSVTENTGSVVAAFSAPNSYLIGQDASIALHTGNGEVNLKNVVRGANHTSFVVEQRESGFLRSAMELKDGGHLQLRKGLSTGDEALPDVPLGGICVNTGDNDGNAFTLKNSDVAHPFTALAETDTYMTAGKHHASAGGVSIKGYSEALVGASLSSQAATVATDTTTPAGIVLNASKSSGTGAVALAANETALTITNNGTNAVTVKGNGGISTTGQITVAAQGTLSANQLVAVGANGAVPLDKGGTGATTAANARTNLGLGTAATYNAGTGVGQLLPVTAGGFGSGFRHFSATLAPLEESPLPVSTNGQSIIMAWTSGTSAATGIAAVFTQTTKTVLFEDTSAPQRPDIFVSGSSIIIKNGHPNTTYVYDVWIWTTTNSIESAINAHPFDFLIYSAVKMGTTGSSTLYGMTQKATTDALNLKRDIGTSQFVAATNGGTTTAASTDEYIILTHAATIASHTVVLPSGSYNGRVFKLGARSAVTTLTMNTTGGQTLQGGLTTIAANGFGQWVYSASNTTWYRVG